MNSFEPNRTEALARLSAFLPKASKTYTSGRNHDNGPGAHDTAVSVLSPYIRHRLITEEEVLQAVLGRHALSSAEKYVQEVFWRTYWKGWLQLRPSIWSMYTAERDKKVAFLQEDTALKRDWEAACGGETGIDCFDHWAHELVDTGYMHNHARMWFASIWVFTLRLPWTLGADFFMRHLLDGDPASNTLSWRWVSGLQTKGKTYLARPDNIAKYTGGRFHPKGLATSAPPLEGPEHPPRLAPPDMPIWDPKKPSGLLLTGEDLSPSFYLEQGLEPVATATWHDGDALSPLGASDRVTAFKDGAQSNVVARWGARLGPTEHVRNAEAIVTWAHKTKAKQIVTPFAPVGPTAEMLDRLRPMLERQGQTLVTPLREYDARCWPYATHGFFKFKEKIPRLVDQLQMRKTA